MYIDIYTQEAYIIIYMFSCVHVFAYMYKYTYTRMDTYFLKCYHNPIDIGKTLQLLEQ